MLNPIGGPRNALLRYTAAACAVVAGLAFRLALGSSLGPTVPYITFIPAVMFAAWFGGLGPGIFASLLTVFVGVLALLPGFYGARRPSPPDRIGVLVFLAVSVFISVLNEALRRSRARSEERSEDLRLEVARRMVAEESLAETSRKAERERDLFRTTLASIGDAVIATDLDGRVTFLNTTAEQITGWTQQDAIGKLTSEVFIIHDEKTRAPGESPIHRAIREGNIVSLANQSILIAKDGREIPIEEGAAPIRDEKQRVFGAVLVFRDVTDRRRSERDLKRSEERLRLALHAGQIGVWDWDASQGGMDWSDRLYEIYGLMPGSFRGGIERFVELIHPEDRDFVRKTVGESLQGWPLHDIHFRIIHSNGEVRWVSTTALIARNEIGETIRMLGATTDITKVKRSEEELKSINQELTRVNRGLEEFVYVASHDLKEPLRMANIFTQLMVQKLGDADAQVKEYGGYLRQSIDRMEALIRDLLEYSHASHADDGPPSHASLQVSLDDALAMLGNEIKESGAIVTAGALPCVRGETSQLSHVFQNLLSNAIKYGRRGVPPQIQLSARREHDEWIVSVQDNGIGFEPQYAERIFGLFKRLHRDEYPGTGLGLAICQRIVERYGGRIWAEGVPGKGATFHFSLPSSTTH